VKEGRPFYLYIYRVASILYEKAMVRKARIDAPGALHYVIIRGIERQAIFKDRLDRRSFLNRVIGDDGEKLKYLLQLLG